MKRLLVALLLWSLSFVTLASKFDCKFLDYYLTLEFSGIQPINHKLKINGELEVVELSKEKWFIEQVKCLNFGFEIIASHVQYNAPKQQYFILTFDKKIGYKIRPINKRR